MKYIPRWLETRLAEVLKSHPVVVLTGPRQVGKSTLLAHAEFLKSWRYITLDDPDALEQAREDPKGLFWEDRPTIIDEAQRCPELMLTVKYLVDKSDRRRNFILSGSGNISLRQAPRETLAGRAKYLHLTGFGYREMHGLPAQGLLDEIWSGQEVKNSNTKSNIDVAQSIWRGCLPGVVLASNEKIALERLSSYIDTYIQRDIQDLVKIRHPQHFRRLMEALAQAVGWESVQDELSKACGETRTNVSRYMSLLKDTNLLYELKGYTVKSERAYKQSKYFWFDSGSACFLAGIHSADQLKKPYVRGRYLENFILQQILIWASLQLTAPEIFYWKLKAGGAEVDTFGGVQTPSFRAGKDYAALSINPEQTTVFRPWCRRIDFVISSAGRTIGIEVKSSNEITFGDTKPMREFLKTHPQVSKGIIVYAGSKIYPVATNIYAVPWTVF